MLTQFFTPDRCAACKLCCNFRRSSAWETPALPPGLVADLQAAGVPLHVREDGSCTFRLTYRSSDPAETANCPMLDTCRGCTLPRDSRPFECRIWPLRLMHTESGQLILGLYRSCPALTPPVREKIIAHATGPLLPTLLHHAEHNPHTVRPLDKAYETIWCK